MSKVTMTFDLSDEEDKYNFKYAMSGSEFSCVISELDNFLRAKLKYENLKDEEYEAYESTRTKLYELKREYNIPED